MAITHQKNGFITTILNQSRKDDIVLLKGSPVIETKVVLPNTKQLPQFYKAEPLRKDNLIQRMIKTLMDLYKQRNSNKLAKALASELGNKESFTTRNRYKKNLQVKESQLEILQKILDSINFAKDEKVEKNEKNSKIGSFFTNKLKFLKKLFKKLFLPFAILSALIGGENWGKFKEVAKNFLNFMQPLFDFLGSIGKNALEIVAKFFEKYPTIKEAAAGLFEGMGKVYKYIREKLREVGLWLGNIWSEYISPNISNIPTVLFDGLNKVYTYIIKKLKGFGRWLGALWDEYVSPNISNIPTVLFNGLNKVYTFVMERLKGFSRWLGGLWDEYIPPSINNIATTLFNGLNKVYTFLTKKIKELGTWLGGLWSEYVSPSLPSIPSLDEVMNGLTEKIGTFYNKIKNFFDSISNAIDSINPFHQTKEDKKIEKLKRKLDKIKELENEIKETKADVEAVKNGNSFANFFRKSEKELLAVLDSQQKKLSELNLKAYRDSIKGVQDVAIIGSKEIKKQVVKNIETTINNNSPKNEVKINILNSANLKELQNALKVAVSKDSKKSLTRKIKVTQQYYDDLAKIETGDLKNKYNVINKYGYTGKYQYGKSTAMPFLKKLGKKWSDFKGNKELQEKIVRMDTESRIPRILKLKKKFGKKEIVTPNDLWISHNMGMKGYKEIVLQPKLAPTKARVRNMSANVDRKTKKEGVTKESYTKYWENRFDKNGVQNPNNEESQIVTELKKLVEISKNSKDGNVEIKDPTVLHFIDDTKEQGVI